jgi:Rieske [2Fe-2S] domain
MSEFIAVLEDNELQGGAMRAVEVEGVPVLVSRSEGGEACAIANTCTHRGGPLTTRANATGTWSPVPGTVLSSTCAPGKCCEDLPESSSSASRPGCVKGR